MSENIDELLAELRKKNIDKKRRRQLNKGVEGPAAPQKKAVKKRDAVYLRAAARIKALDLERKKPKERFNEEELMMIAKRVGGER